MIGLISWPPTFNPRVSQRPASGLLSWRRTSGSEGQRCFTHATFLWPSWNNPFYVMPVIVNQKRLRWGQRHGVTCFIQMAFE